MLGHATINRVPRLYQKRLTCRDEACPAWLKTSNWVWRLRHRQQERGLPFLHARSACEQSGLGLVADSEFCNVGCTSWKWTVDSEDLTTGKSTSLTVSLSDTMTSAYVNLEVQKILYCAYYPQSGSTTFNSLQLTDTQGTITPSWQGYVHLNDGCGENVTINSASSVTLKY